MSDDRETVRVTLYENNYVRGDDELRPLGDVVTWLAGLLESIPQEHRESAWFEVEHEDGYYDSSDSTNFRVYYDRPVTDEELAARAAEQSAKRQRAMVEAEARERAIFEALKRKYEKPPPHREYDAMSMVERVARAISGQDESGWLALPEDDRERLYGGGKWHDDGRTRADYRDDARAAIEAMREPTEEVIRAMRGRALFADCLTDQGARDIYSNIHSALTKGTDQ